MSDDVAIVHGALHSRGWRSVASALGLKWSGDRIPCPLHGGNDHNFDLDEHDGRLNWICSSHCGSGDVLELIQRLSGVGFREALREAADIAGVVLDDGTERSDEERAKIHAQREAYAEAARNRPAERVKPRPDPRQGGMLWDASQTPSRGSIEWNHLASRGIDPDMVALLGLARSIPPGSPMPSWATYKGRSWLETGHTLIVQTFDEFGRFVGLRAWRCEGDEDTPKRLPQAGYSAKGLVLANRQACEMLRYQTPGLLVVSEGEPDWMVHAIRDRYAVVGITSGSWTQAIADRIPFGSEVVVRTDNDEAGDKYAKHIRQTLRERVTLWRKNTA